jgi:hypothetical protein
MNFEEVEEYQAREQTLDHRPGSLLDRADRRLDIPTFMRRLVPNRR